MTTPEQLQVWLEEFESAYSTVELKRIERNDNGTIFLEYENVYRSKELQCYLRAKQETAQAIKDARKQALEDALAIVKNENKTGDMEFEIKELLND